MLEWTDWIEEGRMTRCWQLLIGLIVLIGGASGAQAFTLETVKQRDLLNCGVTAGVRGFATADETGRWQGLDVDICRAVAAAVLGDAEKVKFVALPQQAQLTALLSGTVDMLSAMIPWTLTIDSSMGLLVTGISFYDGQSFLVKKRLGVKSALELDGATICLPEGRRRQDHLNDFFREHELRFTSTGHDTLELATRELVNGRCEVITDSRSRLYSLRLLLEHGDEYLVLPEVISREPHGPIVRQGDDGWFAIVRWVLFTLLTAEEYGLRSDTIDTVTADTDPRVQDFIGQTGNFHKGLGLDARWAYRIIKQVGNYAEIFERTVGHQSTMGMDRGLNALWNRGGLHYAPPMR
ncbi:MAG: transporter substrate-binding domain-containing protein [Desulfofustis sp.]|jgi:general L-amino acid transport system substrate-binding protein|nr:transporter substrate-binding domain-containing protein [Desulfofustis sp.]